MDEDPATMAENTHSQSPPSITHSQPSDPSPAPSNPIAAQEQAAQEAFELEQADQYIYDLMRLFASAMRALAIYDTQLCLDELEKLPHVHQRSALVMATVGRAHFERTDYTAVRIQSRGSGDLTDLSLALQPLSNHAGGTCLPSGPNPGAISLMGYGGVFDPSMASPEIGATFVSGTGALSDRLSLASGMDCYWKYLFAPEGTRTSFDVFQACSTVGPHLRVRVHPRRTRID